MKSVRQKVGTSRSLVLLLVLITGCATVFNDSNPPVSMESEPVGSEVYLDGELLGRTPITIRLSTANPQYLTFKKDGYVDRTYVLETHAGALWVVLDVLTGLIPIIVDAATGSWNEFNTESVHVSLEPLEGS